jgi:hypothetical protein
MSFLAPLAFFFALSLPAVVVFYLLKRKRVTKLVPSTLLWQKFLAETQASAPFQRLRHNWLLLFQLLLLLLAVLALARPYFSGRIGQGSLQIVVLDASASMQSADEAPNRFEKARTEALKLVDGLDTRRGQQMVVLVAAAQAEVKQSATSEKSALRRALQSAEVTDSSTRLAEALRVAETLTRNNPASEVHLFSDGAGVDLSEFESKDLPLVFHRIGQRANNLGIVTLDVKANPEDATKRALFTSIANYSAAEADTTVELYFDGQLVETKPVNVAPTNTTPVVFVAAQPRDGVFTVRLTAKDDLATDNEASVISLLPQPVNVLLVTKGNRFLEKALVAAGDKIELTTAPDLTDPTAKYDLVVLDDVPPAVWPAANVLAIHVANTNWFDGGIGSLETPAIVDWRNTHPLLRFVNFDNVQIAQSLSVKTPAWGVPLVDSPQTPLVLAGELGRQRLLWIGFDTLQSTWPLRISFPIFIANAVDWLNPATAKADQFLVHAGDAFRFPLGDLAGTVTSASVTAPGAAEKVVPVDPKARELVYGNTARRGIYQVALGTNRLAFAVNLLDAAESNTRPQDQLSVGRRGDIAATKLRQANLEYWRWFAAAALAVLMFEWWWFHRRTA